MLVVSEAGLGEDMADPAEIKLTRCMVQGLLEGTALRETLSPTDTVREAGIFTVQDGTGVAVGLGVPVGGGLLHCLHSMAYGPTVQV
ncbi:MAG: hypothetical protein Q8N39_01425 [Pelolinea sp.]|nr:hypothetical protein [Pelolinea sp.]